MIEVKNLKKSYRPKKGDIVHALKGINLQFEEKGLVFILGKSGSGKSTLLNMLGGLDQFDDGEIIIKGKSSKQFAQADFDSYRNTFIGFIFQEYNILNDFTVGANIALAMELQGKKPTNETLNKILQDVDLAGFANRKPNELSGGQKQRVAIARALIKNPEIIMADEPTGALDSNTGKQVFDTLKQLAKEKLVIVVSHDREFAEQYGDRVIEMRDGEVISDIKKYKAESANVNEGIQIIEDKIIHIKSGYELTIEDMNMINEYLKKNKGHDSFISLDDRTNEKIKQVAKIDEAGNQEAFKETTAEDLVVPSYDGSKLKFIKSKLPFKSSIKLAAGSLKKKPFRLVMTILLSTVAFTLFGLANTMSSYDKMKAGTDSIMDSNVDYTSFTKKEEVKDGDYTWYNDAKLSDADVDNIQKKFPDQTFTKVLSNRLVGFDFYQNLFKTENFGTLDGVSYYPTEFSGSAVITPEVIKNMGYELTGNLPQKDNEIVITKVVAESFVKAGYKKAEEDAKEEAVSSADQMIGKKLHAAAEGDVEYTITGVLDTKFDNSRYEFLLTMKQSDENKYSSYMLQQELQNVYRTSYHTLAYVSQAAFDKKAEGNKIFESDGMMSGLRLWNNDSGFTTTSFIENANLDDSMKKNIILFDSNKKSLGAGEIILPVSMIDSNGMLSQIVHSDKTVDEITAELIKNKNQITSMQFEFMVENASGMTRIDNIKVVGINVDVENAFANVAVVADGFFEQNGIDTSGKYGFVVGKMPEDRAGVQEVLAYSYDNGIEGIRYSLQNCTSEMLETVNEAVKVTRTVFMWVGIVFAVFASIMLMNFIATSISYRKREIGILRAVGARGRDVFMIFLQESTIIALINWVTSTCVTAVLVFLANSSIREEFNFVITVLHFGVLQIGLMLVLCIAVAFLASFIPVFRVSRKKPIEVIRKN